MEHKILDSEDLRKAYASGDMHAYALAAIALGISYTDDLMVTHKGDAAKAFWAEFGDLLPWER